ncbi:hypothetical protein PTT_07022 [Pyrenophora teres f. teres 0-1]|uniref:DUF6604 domain-containing protein n=1 Tax=Pyrenophora teres f. teres (strain 0-1) TaxID=861557 RepID=E3RGS1_PYRTT|nr:hypothetical protein PTT_07022 [Pyrenophora teres f. teres 0-1]
MGRYEAIEAHTNVAVSWVIEAARAHGNDVRAFNDRQSQGATSTRVGSTVPKPGRLKGKARREAKQNALKSASTTTYKISTEEILRQVQYLQNLGVSIVMSRNVSFAFRTSVRGRQGYAERFAQEQPEHQENAGHVYFLDVLRRVAEMLSEVVQVQKRSFGQRATEANSFKVANMFEALSIDEIDESINNLPPDDSAPETSNESSKTCYEPAIDVSEEFNLRWYCFRDDVVSITG